MVYQWRNNLNSSMSMPLPLSESFGCTCTCICLSLIWLHLSLINELLDYLQLAVPLHLVRQRELEDAEQNIAGEYTLGAISIRMIAF
ncbi:uncharacterized protein LOC6591575 [Drosophila persimilis]|uniref:Uncharacterized protein n=2 Tax=pseudoobscura subgroup TaxID=32358 RepID=A0A6I8V602_DROPS|nr:uncharacterized protein LOC6591575 [Drosophila persimilis]XP_003736776.2 uncharacterized protein LOC13036360 [Drosophila pseudoobscura]